jgi:phosphoribosylglycinamide formyltransferase-1
MKNIAIFASGNGTNAQKLIDHFDSGNIARVALIITNNPKAYVIERAKASDVPSLLIEKKSFTETTQLLEELKKYKIDLIVLAGFLWMIPVYLIKAFPNKIVNIHPALLPKYGGKGMYGDRVHEAVIANKEKESGITIHYVNEQYDEGKIILQAKCEVSKTDTPETLANKIHELEHKHYILEVEKLARAL